MIGGSQNYKQLLPFLLASQDGTLLGNPSGTDNPFAAAIDEQIGYGQATAQLGHKLASETSLSALMNSFLNEEGSKKALQMNQYSNQANIDLDLQNLQQRQNYGIQNKQIEQYLLDQMVKEKLDNMFYELERTQMQNTFGLAKNVVNAARYG